MFAEVSPLRDARLLPGSIAQRLIMNERGELT
jgi:hypothetical protein